MKTNSKDLEVVNDFINSHRSAAMMAEDAFESEERSKVDKVIDLINKRRLYKRIVNDQFKVKRYELVTIETFANDYASSIKEDSYYGKGITLFPVAMRDECYSGVCRVGKEIYYDTLRLKEGYEIDIKRVKDRLSSLSELLSAAENDYSILEEELKTVEEMSGNIID